MNPALRGWLRQLTGREVPGSLEVLRALAALVIELNCIPRS
jgi:hypothetical protein